MLLNISVLIKEGVKNYLI